MNKWTQKQVDAWNAKWPPESACILIKDSGTEVETRTRSAAWLLESGHPLVLVKHFTGGKHLDRLRMKKASKLAVESGEVGK